MKRTPGGVAGLVGLTALLGTALAVGLVTWTAGKESRPMSAEIPPPAPLAPQGNVPQFVVECGLSHSAPDDPVVHPGHAGHSHLHDFFGATTTDARSTPESLAAGATTCKDAGDTAAYWAPALLADDEPVIPRRSVAYYRPGPGVDHESIEPWPFGLVMLAGNPQSETAQPLGVIAWQCGASERLSDEPADCPQSAPLSLRVTFPDCWDGERLDSQDHQSHVAYSNEGACPDSHPVPVVQLVFKVEYPATGYDPTRLSLASGPVHTAHADVINAWDPDRLERQVRTCINRGQVCGVSSTRTNS